jgi:microsomal dipeptidase-like Zn-dependent dipeptidase
VLAESERLGVVVDLAHASPATRRDVIAMATRPLVVSHTAVRGTCAGPRNLTDEDLAAVAGTGGVVGIGFFEGATCGDDVESILAAIEHVAKIAGVDYAAIGSDFDGAIAAPFDASGMALVTQGLLARGLSPGDVAKIMGGNVARVLDQTLPDPSP